MFHLLPVRSDDSALFVACRRDTVRRRRVVEDRVHACACGATGQRPKGTAGNRSVRCLRMVSATASRRGRPVSSRRSPHRLHAAAAATCWSWPSCRHGSERRVACRERASNPRRLAPAVRREISGGQPARREPVGRAAPIRNVPRRGNARSVASRRVERGGVTARCVVSRCAASEAVAWWGTCRREGEGLLACQRHRTGTMIPAGGFKNQTRTLRAGREGIRHRVRRQQPEKRRRNQGERNNE